MQTLAVMESLPLFPLHAVLLPGGILPLKVFEARYMDMAKDCLKNNSPFGICLIAEGKEVGQPAVPHAVGTLARISQWDMEQLGVLQLTLCGGERFRILEHSAQQDGLLRGRVEILPPAPRLPVPEAMAPLQNLLRIIAADLGPARLPQPHHFDDVDWVGLRFTEVLPIPPLARQKLLELDDPLNRLEIIQQYLRQHKLVQD